MWVGPELGHPVGEMTGDPARPLACVIAVLFGLASIVAVIRLTDSRSPAAIAVEERSEEPPAHLGRAPEDQLPLSDPTPLNLAKAGYVLPPGGSVYAARIVEGGDRPHYVDYVAGGGALAENFWPASSIKVLAALGALDFVGSLGFTGAATVTFDTGYSATLREIYRSAVLDSDNLDYDVLIRVAGFDWLNTEFLSPANGFPTTVIQRSYAGIDVRWSPEMTLEEGGITVVVPARESRGEYDCPDEGNCANLFELTEAIRRLVLDGSIPEEERFAIDPDDVEALADDLAGSGSFFGPGVEWALGAGATVQSKPGVAFGLDCVDTAVVTTASGDRYLLSAAIPDDGYEEACEGLADLAAAVLRLLAAP